MHSETEVAQTGKADGAGGVPGAVRAELEGKLSTGSLELPLLPGVAMELTSVAAKEDVDARTIADMLKQDRTPRCRRTCCVSSTHRCIAHARRSSACSKPWRALASARSARLRVAPASGAFGFAGAAAPSSMKPITS